MGPRVSTGRHRIRVENPTWKMGMSVRSHCCFQLKMQFGWAVRICFHWWIKPQGRAGEVEIVAVFCPPCISLAWESVKGVGVPTEHKEASDQAQNWRIPRKNAKFSFFLCASLPTSHILLETGEKRKLPCWLQESNTTAKISLWLLWGTTKTERDESCRELLISKQ